MFQDFELDQDQFRRPLSRYRKESVVDKGLHRTQLGLFRKFFQDSSSDASVINGCRHYLWPFASNVANRNDAMLLAMLTASSAWRGTSFTRSEEHTSELQS